MQSCLVRFKFFVWGFKLLKCASAYYGALTIWGSGDRENPEMAGLALDAKVLGFTSIVDEY